MEREQFSSRLGFILISAGCAIGLGNVYRFPITTGAYGGAIFVAIYLLFLLLLGIPVMTAELAVGRGSRRSIATSFETLQHSGQKWGFMKYVGIVGNYLLMMFYTTISGWMVIYFWKYLTGSIMGVTGAEALGGVFGATVSNPVLQICTTFLVILVCFSVCSLGLQKGVEKITKGMMVALLVLIIGLAIYCCTLPGAGAGLKFYLVPSLERLEEAGVWTVISSAMGQAFFTLSIGIGSIAIFGSYIDKNQPARRSVYDHGSRYVCRTDVRSHHFPGLLCIQQRRHGGRFQRGRHIPVHDAVEHLQHDAGRPRDRHPVLCVHDLCVVLHGYLKTSCPSGWSRRSSAAGRSR